MASPSVRLRPTIVDDLAILESIENSPDRAGEHSFHGYRGTGTLERRFASDGLIGDDHGTLVVEVDGACAGTVSWHAMHYGRPPMSTCWNIGIQIGPEHRGRGVGTRAQELIVDYLFAHTTVERIEASTDVANLAEQRSLEKAGFVREGILRRAQFRDGCWHDMVGYSRIRPEWTPPVSGAG